MESPSQECRCICRCLSGSAALTKTIPSQQCEGGGAPPSRCPPTELGTAHCAVLPVAFHNNSHVAIRAACVKLVTAHVDAVSARGVPRYVAISRCAGSQDANAYSIWSRPLQTGLCQHYTTPSVPLRVASYHFLKGSPFAHGASRAWHNASRSAADCVVQRQWAGSLELPVVCQKSSLDCRLDSLRCDRQRTWQ